MLIKHCVLSGIMSLSLIFSLVLCQIPEVLNNFDGEIVISCKGNTKNICFQKQMQFFALRNNCTYVSLMQSGCGGGGGPYPYSSFLRAPSRRDVALFMREVLSNLY